LGEPEEQAPEKTVSETHEANGLRPGSQKLKALYNEVAKKVQEYSKNSHDILKAKLPALCTIERLAHPDSVVPQNKLGLTLGLFGRLLKLYWKRTAFVLLMLALPGGLIILGLCVFCWAVNCGNRLAVIPLMLPPLQDAWKISRNWWSTSSGRPKLIHRMERHGIRRPQERQVSN
jgi:hypothetical protein